MVKRLAGCLLALAFTPALRAQEAVAFDRPGIGFSTATVPRGVVAWEQGLPDAAFSRDAGSRSRLLVADTLLRLGLTDALELQVGADSHAWLHLHDGDGIRDAHGAGNASIGLKRALPASSAGFSWALLASAGLPTGRAPIGGGERDYALGVTAQWELERERSVSLYLDRGFGGERGWMLSPSYGFALGGDWAGYVEAGIGTGDRKGRLLGTGMTWQPSPRLQFDLSVLRGSGGAPDWQGGFGVALAFP